MKFNIYALAGPLGGVGFGGSVGGGAISPDMPRPDGLDKVISFEFVFENLEKFYNTLLGLWKIVATPMSQIFAETLSSLKMPEGFKDALQWLFSQTFLADVTPLGLVIGFSMSIFLVMTIINWLSPIRSVIPL